MGNERRKEFKKWQMRHKNDNKCLVDELLKKISELNMGAKTIFDYNIRNHIEQDLGRLKKGIEFKSIPTDIKDRLDKISERINNQKTRENKR